MNILKGLMIMGLVSFLAGCAGPSMDHYNNSTPTMNVKEYFTGPIKAWGIVQDWRGNVVRRFDVDMIGTWDGNVGTLDEDFVYYDGEKQKRIWTITKIDDTTYEGTADDILGIAKGELNGNALRWAYQMDLPVDGRTFRVTFDDWMFLMNDGVLMNRSYIKKFGVTVAELTLVMQKQEE